MGPIVRTYVYVDGFNLYYGCLKNTPYRWLNLDALSRRIYRRNDIRRIRYFTAHITPRPHKPQELANQLTYIRALETLPTVHVHLGTFLVKRTKGMLIDPRTNKVTSQVVSVAMPEEKGSDVNLATHLVADAFAGAFDVAIIVSNDTDLVEPIKVVRDRLGLHVGVLSPFKSISWPLRNAAEFYRCIRESHLKVSQFPPTMSDRHGRIVKPAGW